MRRTAKSEGGWKKGALLAAAGLCSLAVLALSASSIAKILMPEDAPPALEDSAEGGGILLPREAFETLAFLTSNKGKADQTRFTVPVWDTQARISGLYGWRENPITGEGREFHEGLDIAARKGSQVLASRDGMVTASYDDKYMGQTIEITHGDGVVTIYAHMCDRVAKPGDTVVRGETIGHVGYTGRSTGPHLHFGIKKTGGCVDPMPYLWQDAARVALVKN